MSLKLPHKNFCPKCGKAIEGVTQFCDGVEQLPEVGDVSVCVYCYTLLQFDDNIKSQALTPDEFLALDDDVRLDLTRALKMVIEVIGDKI